MIEWTIPYDVSRHNSKQSGVSEVRLELVNQWIYQQDNDPKHTARPARGWILYYVPKPLHTPPQSPCLNSIEQPWDELEHSVR